jgi:hypothetical protein
VKQQQNYYRIKPLNACSVEASFGMESSSILLKATPFEDEGVRLRWTAYEHWDTGVDTYRIEIWNQATGQWEYVKSVYGNVTETFDR